MNEPEVRARVHAAFGEATYPAALTERVARRLNAPASPRHSRSYAFVAAALAILLVAALVMTRLELPRIGTQSEAPARAVAGPVDPNAKVPDPDLTGAGLYGPAAELVTPLNLVAESHGRSLALIGAYADTSEIALFFRSTSGVMVQTQIYDRTGSLNYGSSGTDGIPGDIVFVLGGGPHAGPDGLAHLNVIASDLQMAFDSSSVPGTWSFSFAIRVQKPTPLTISPGLSSSGSWKFRVEAFEVTPAVVRLQAVVDGVSIRQVGAATISVVDSSGAPVQPRSSSTVLVGQRFLFWTFGDRPTLEVLTWTRPPVGDYTLVITGPGIAYRGAFTIP
jgi:hypothetical protein